MTPSAQSSTSAEFFLVAEDGITPLTINDYRVRTPDGELAPATFRSNGAIGFENVGQKVIVEFVRRTESKQASFELMLEQGDLVFIKGCVNPVTGEIKDLEQKVWTSTPRPQRTAHRRMGDNSNRPSTGGPPVNDNCAGAIALDCDTTVVGDNTNATTNVDDPGLSCHFSGPGTQVVGSLWYTFVPTGDSVRVTTEGSVAPADDSLLAIYDGSCGALVELGCSEDEGTGLLSDLTVTGLTAGNTYYLQVGCFGEADRGAYNINIECLGGGGDPGGGGDNDECADATLIDCNTSVAADNSTATTAVDDPGLSCHFSGPGTQGTNTIWFKFVATGSEARITTNGSLPPADDSLLGIYSGTCGALTEIGCSEDEGDGLLSDVTVTGLTTGETYYIQLASFSIDDVGEYLLTLECGDAPPPPTDLNDECADAILMECDTSVLADNTTATTAVDDPGLSCHFSGPGTQGTNTLWFKFVATGNTARVTTNGSLPPADDSLLGIYSGSCGALTEIGCSEDEGDGLLSDVTVSTLTAGETYYIQLASFSIDDVGEYLLTLECSDVVPVTNDDCADAEPLAVPAIITVDTTTATTDGIGDGCDTVEPANNVWYSIIGTGGDITVETCSLNSAVLDTVINVFCNDCGDLLNNCVAGNDDDCVDGADGFQSTVTFCSQDGAEYLVSVGGFGSGDAGVIEIETSNGAASCDLDVACIPLGACCLEDGTCVDATEADCASLGGEFFGEGTTCNSSNLVADGSFEGGAGSSAWAQSSVNFGSPICSVANCGNGGGSGAHDGQNWFWAGGTNSFEVASVAQLVTIPSDSTEMSFWYEIPVSSGSTSDFIEVTIDGMTVETITAAEGPFIGYQQRVVNIAAFADGAQHELAINGTTDGQELTNIFLDDVVILASGAGVDCRDCFVLDFEGFVNGHAVGSGDFADADIAGIGDNNYGAAIYDSSDPGPNSGGSDNDLLVNQGGVLILQESGQQSVPGVFDNPDDAQLGGDLFIDFSRPFFVDSLDLIDIDSNDKDCVVTLRDSGGNERRYLVPAGWTANGGVGTLDTRTSDAQPGDSATATVLSSDAGYDESAVIQIEVELAGSGAVDNVIYCE